MADKEKKPINKWTLLMGIGVGLVFLVLCAFIISLMLSEDVEKRQRQIQKVTIVKPPPPPPKVEEPEPEVEKEEIKEPEPEPEPEMPEESEEPPSNEQLGLDAEGAAGSDAFGLAAKKGGRAITLGGGGGGSQYLWYTRLLVDQLQKSVNDILKERGGMPDEKLQTIVRVYLDDSGGIREYKIVGSSGNSIMDEAVRDAISGARLRQSPPEGMPRAMQFKIYVQG